MTRVSGGHVLRSLFSTLGLHFYIPAQNMIIGFTLPPRFPILYLACRGVEALSYFFFVFLNQDNFYVKYYDSFDVQEIKQNVKKR